MLELPHREILLAQRVNKTFRNTITRSSPIQQKLFFKAGPLSNEGKPELNPLLPRILRLFYPECKLQIFTDRPGGYRELIRISDGNKLSSGTVHVKDPVWSWLHYDNENTSARPEVESWQRMLAADPPCNFEVDMYKVCYGPESVTELLQAIHRVRCEANEATLDGHDGFSIHN